MDSIWDLKIRIAEKLTTKQSQTVFH